MDGLDDISASLESLTLSTPREKIENGGLDYCLYTGPATPAIDNRTINEKTMMALFELASQVRSNSYSPYSLFKVGAAVLTKSGNFYTGTNVENASFGGGILPLTKQSVPNDRPLFLQSVTGNGNSLRLLL